VIVDIRILELHQPLRSVVAQLNRFAGQEFDVRPADDNLQRLGAGHFDAALSVLDNDGDVVVDDQVVFAVAHKVVVLAVKGAVMRVSVALADGVADQPRAIPGAALAGARVTVAFNAAALFVLVLAILARTRRWRDALAVVQDETVRTTAAFYAFGAGALALLIAASLDEGRAAIVINLPRGTTSRTEVVRSPGAGSLSSFPDAFPDEGLKGATGGVVVVAVIVDAIAANCFFAGAHKAVGGDKAGAFAEISFRQLGAMSLRRHHLRGVAIAFCRHVHAVFISDFVADSKGNCILFCAEIIVRAVVVVATQTAHFRFETGFGDFNRHKLLFVPA